jgi:hypothetical protein
MTRDGHHFLKELASFPASTFEGRFFQMSRVLDLGTALTETELMLLYEAGFYATLCNISFNGLGGCSGAIKPERESNRIRLEHAFMAAREALYASPGWTALPSSKKASVQTKFLKVYVAPDSLVW